MMLFGSRPGPGFRLSFGASETSLRNKPKVLCMTMDHNVGKGHPQRAPAYCLSSEPSTLISFLHDFPIIKSSLQLHLGIIQLHQFDPFPLLLQIFA